MVASLALFIAMSPIRMENVPTLKIEHLRCGYLVNPIGVDAHAPSLSWKPVAADSQSKNLAQRGYAILVATSPKLLVPGKADLWDSGKTQSPDSFGIPYKGKPLSPGSTAYWKVRVFDQAGRPSPWSQTAFWIAGPKWSARWIQFPRTEKKTADGEPNNGFHGGVRNHPNDTQWVQVDLGKSTTILGVTLFPARPYDFDDTPGFLFPVRFKIEASDDPGFKHPRPLVADYIRHDFPNPGANPVKFMTENDGRYIRVTVLKLAQRDPESYSYALAELQVLTDDGNLALHRPVTASDSTEVGAWSKTGLVDGTTVSHGKAELKALPTTQLRKEFTVAGKVRKAVAYASAMGVYELRINGKRVGDHVLAPEWTDYRDRVQYQGYDVTALLKKGPNAVAAVVGDGWYAGRVAWFGRGIWGRTPSFLCQIEVELTDGSRKTVVSDGSWSATDAGPVRSSDILDGETYDARKVMAGWDEPGFDAKAWDKVRVLDTPKAKLVAQPNEPIRVVQELRPTAVTEPKPGVYVLDMGQNMVGWVRAKLQGQAGGTAVLRFAEALNDDGTIYRDNLRGAPQIDRYTFATDMAETWEPHFTYHGFRYVEVTGVNRKLEASDVTGMVFCSSAPTVGAFECSDPMLTRLWQNIYWTQRANMMSTPTDCPQRDERLGWCGDIQAFGQTAVYSMDMDGFFAKWAQDLRDGQTQAGMYPEFAPFPSAKDAAAGSPAWSDAGVFVPWTAYLNYGDKQLLRDHFESAKKYVDLLHRLNPDGLWLNGRGNDFNDWLNGDTIVQQGWPTTGGAVPPEVLGTAFMARSTQIVADMARVLGQASDAKRYSSLAAKCREAFCKAYVATDGRIKGDTQAGYALALNFDLLPAGLRPVAMRHMVEAVGKYNDHLSTGIQTSHRLMLELSRWGRNDLAAKLALTKSFPSWGYSVENGATTIWERWDGYVKGRGFQNPGMNSLNHWAIGSVGEWMMKAIGGLWPGEEPGWAHPVIRPMPEAGLTWAKASYDSVRGVVACSWRLTEFQFEMEVEVPVGATATVYVPLVGRDSVRVEGAKFVRKESGSAIYLVGSGRYRFVVR